MAETFKEAVERILDEPQYNLSDKQVREATQAVSTAHKQELERIADGMKALHYLSAEVSTPDDQKLQLGANSQLAVDQAHVKGEM